MNIIKDFLIQITLIVIPMFSFHTFFAERLKEHKRENLVKCATWGLSLLLVMSFPVNFSSDYRLDIRAIPLILGSLYCGLKTGMVLASLIILFRMYMGGIDIAFCNTVLALIFSMPVILFFQKSFVSAKRDKRIIIAVFLSLLYVVIGTAWFCILRTISFEYLKIQTIYLIMIVFFTGLFTAVNEMIRETYQLRFEVQQTKEKLEKILEYVDIALWSRNDQDHFVS